MTPIDRLFREWYPILLLQTRSTHADYFEL